MKLFAAAILVAGLLGLCSVKSHAQVNFGTATNQFTYTPVNNGTGGIVGVVIPNGGGTVVNVATGSAALPLQNIANTPGATNLYLGDDSGQNVPLGFTFPYWGQNFTNSWMYSNGIVSFVNGNLPGAGCCSGLDLSRLTDTRYNYMIAPMWTDLIDTTGQATWYKRTTDSMIYGWYGTKEYGTNNSNSFEVDINSTGAFNVRYGNAYITNHYVTSGFTGDLSKGQWFQYRYGQGMNIPSTNPVSYGTSAPMGGVDPCTADPLSSSTCPGYAAAYLSQQCTISALYDPTCPGYQVAYFNQQCTINPLYNSACPGYPQAYHDLQCSINSLYATDCPGYAAAYLSQQCSLNTLYSSACPGYETAYRNYLFAQACQANPQSAPTCPGYVTPTTTTTTTTSTTTSSTTTTPTTTTSTAVAPTTTTTAVTTTLSTSAPETTVSVSTSGTLTSPTQVATVSDPVVNNVITNNNTTTASPASSPAAATSTATTSNSPTSPTATTAAATSTAPAPAAPAPQQTRTSMSTQKPTKEQAAAVANNAMKDGENASNMEQQKQVQNVIIGAMGFVPGFDAYNVALRDVAFYKPYSIYGNQKTIDNRSASRGLFGATDAVHNDMVNSQYNRGN
jgi:hypothetical protein